MQSILEKLKNGIVTQCAEETESIGIALAKHLKNDTTLALHGNLGVGKTTFVKGLAKGLGIERTVTSPTFNLYTIYEGRLQLVHLDAYRLNPETELDSLMLDDFLMSPFCLVIEWPQNVDPSLVKGALHLELSILKDNKGHTIQIISD